MTRCAWTENSIPCHHHVKRRSSRYCELHRGIAKDLAIARIRERAELSAGRRQEANYLLETAQTAGELASSRMTPGGDGSAWVEVRPANTSFAHHARRDGWKRGPKGGVRVCAPGDSQAQREGWAVAAANALRLNGISAFAILEPAWK